MTKQDRVAAECRAIIADYDAPVVEWALWLLSGIKDEGDETPEELRDPVRVRALMDVALQMHRMLKEPKR